MSVRIGGLRRWDLGVFCCRAEIVFCKMRGQRSLSGQHYHRTLISGVSAAMAQCRRRRPGPGPAQLSRTVSQNSLRKALITLRPSSPSYRSRFYSFLKLAVQPDTDTATWAAAARGRILGESCRLHCAGHSSALHRRRIITITITWSCHHFVSLHEDYG